MALPWLVFEQNAKVNNTQITLHKCAGVLLHMRTTFSMERNFRPTVPERANKNNAYATHGAHSKTHLYWSSVMLNLAMCIRSACEAVDAIDMEQHKLAAQLAQPFCDSPSKSVCEAVVATGTIHGGKSHGG